MGEPAQASRSLFSRNVDSQSRNKETEDLKKQISSIQASLSAITASLDNQNEAPNSLNAPQGQPPIRSASVPSQFPPRMPARYDSNDVHDQYSLAPVRDRSYSPHRYTADNGPYSPTAMSAPISANS